MIGLLGFNRIRKNAKNWQVENYHHRVRKRGTLDWFFACFNVDDDYVGVAQAVEMWSKFREDTSSNLATQIDSIYPKIFLELKDMPLSVNAAFLIH